jgi:uncharacterized BrkB/YihY/UPF0761 family membrane protein
MKIIARFASLLVVSTFALPALASVTTFKDLINSVFITGLLRPLVPLLVGLAVVVFIYGVVTMVIAEGDKKEDGKQYMIWGIVGIFVMVSVWGLVNILISTFGLDPTVQPIRITVPGVTTP